MAQTKRTFAAAGFLMAGAALALTQPPLPIKEENLTKGFQLYRDRFYSVYPLVTVPGMAKLDAAKGNEAKPNEAKAGDAKPSDPKPADKPVDGKPVDGKPVEEKPRPLAPPVEIGEIVIVAGQRTTCRLKIERNGFNDRVQFEIENLPHGVIVDDIGLNGDRKSVV